MKTKLSYIFFLITVWCMCIAPLYSQPYSVSGIIINEVYYNTTSNNGGNWNGGPANIYTDQFIELYNTTMSDIDISGWVVATSTGFSFRFKDTTIILAQASLVLAKSIGNYIPPLGHLALSVDNSGNLTGTYLYHTTGDCIFLINPGPSHSVGDPTGDDVWMTFSTEGAADAPQPYNGRPPNGTFIGHEVDSHSCLYESITRDPDITGSTWQRHLVLNSSAACSPNKKSDNTSPLPVTFVSFSGSYSSDAQHVVLQWSTSDEKNSVGFTIERKSDYNPAWEYRGFIKSYNTALSLHEYTFQDTMNISDGVRFYYRLREIDSDGSESFSSILAVDAHFPDAFDLYNYPNPFGSINSNSTTITLNVTSTDANKLMNVSIYDRFGRLISTLYEGTATPGYITIPFSANGLVSGNYFCKVHVGEKEKIRMMQYIK